MDRQPLPFDDVTIYWDWYLKHHPVKGRGISYVNASDSIRQRFFHGKRGYGGYDQEITLAEICNLIGSGEALSVGQVGPCTVHWHIEKLFETGYISKAQRDRWLTLYDLH